MKTGTRFICRLILEMEMFQTKVAEKMKFYVNYFFENRAV